MLLSHWLGSVHATEIVAFAHQYQRNLHTNILQLTGFLGDFFESEREVKK